MSELAYLLPATSKVRESLVESFLAEQTATFTPREFSYGAVFPKWQAIAREAMDRGLFKPDQRPYDVAKVLCKRAQKMPRSSLRS